MPLVISGRTYGLGALIALLVLIACFVLAIIGHGTLLILLALIGALALAYLIG